MNSDDPSFASRHSTLGLQNSRLLSGLDRQVLDRVARECRWQRHPRGQRVTSKNAPDRDVYLIVGGAVRVTAYSESGRQVTFRDLRAGDWLGDLSAIDGRIRSADVDTLEDTVLATMTQPVFMQLLREQPVVAERVMVRLVELIRDLTQRLFDLSTLGVNNRIHAELLRLAREAGISGNTARIAPMPRHVDIASRVSTSREQVSRELSQLAKSGWLKKDGDGFVICDVAHLEKSVREASVPN